MIDHNGKKTAFVLAAGGSFGAVQAGMLRELVADGVVPYLVMGSSVNAINGAYFAGVPTAEGVAISSIRMACAPFWSGAAIPQSRRRGDSGSCRGDRYAR